MASIHLRPELLMNPIRFFAALRMTGGGCVIFESAGFDDGKEVPAEFGFGGGVEEEGDYR